MEFDYPTAEAETKIVARRQSDEKHFDLVAIGQKVRNLRGLERRRVNAPLIYTWRR